MSSVRMCDQCGQVFSEKEEGWSTGTGSMFKTNEKTGRREQIQVEQDKCSDCTELGMAPRRASLPLEGGRPHYDAGVVDADVIND